MTRCWKTTTKIKRIMKPFVENGTTFEECYITYSSPLNNTQKFERWSENGCGIMEIIEMFLCTKCEIMKVYVVGFLFRVIIKHLLSNWRRHWYAGISWNFGTVFTQNLFHVDCVLNVWSSSYIFSFSSALDTCQIASFTSVIFSNIAIYSTSNRVSFVERFHYSPLHKFQW